MGIGCVEGRGGRGRGVVLLLSVFRGLAASLRRESGSARLRSRRVVWRMVLTIAAHVGRALEGAGVF